MKDGHKGSPVRASRQAQAWLIAILLVLAAHPAFAALTRAQLASVRAAPQAEIVVPLDLPLTDLRGRPMTLRQAVAKRPTLLMLADWRCTQLCGSMLGIAAQALAGSGLKPNSDFSVVVAGFNPQAGVGDGATMRDQQIALYPDLRTNARFVSGEPAVIEQIENALGFTAIRDAASERYAHPADLYVLTAEGRVSRVLNGLSLDPQTVRLALIEAGEGRIGSLADRLHVLCYGLDPLSGASTGIAEGMLRAGATLTMVFGALFAGVAFRHGRARERR